MSDSHLIKTCAQCGQRKSVQHFHRKAQMPDGYRGICRSCTAEKTREYRAKYPDVVAASKKRWTAKNTVQAREYVRLWRESQKASGTSYTARVRDRNPEMYARLMAKWAKRRADRVQATPSWFDPEKVASIYRQAGRMRKAGFDVHVDHYYPLGGMTVCGLHVHNNLRIIPAKDNLAKGAKIYVAAENILI